MRSRAFQKHVIVTNLFANPISFAFFFTFFIYLIFFHCNLCLIQLDPKYALDNNILTTMQELCT